MSVTLDVDLLDLYTGAEFNVTYTRQEVGLNLVAPAPVPHCGWLEPFGALLHLT